MSSTVVPFARQACVLVLGLVMLAGCGAGMPGGGGASKEAAMAPPADRDADGYTDEVDRAESDEELGGAKISAAEAEGAPPAPAPPPSPGGQAPQKAQVNIPGPAQTAPTAKPEEKPSEPAGPKSTAGQLLIYRATLQLAVFETKKAMDQVEKLAKDEGGYLVSRADTSITVRVPSKKFDSTLNRIIELGDMLHRRVSVDDVTEQFHDMQIRLRNLEVVRNRLEELLKKAATVTEAISVERELERVTTEIERLKGRLKLFSELIQFSTITVNFQARASDHLDNQVRLPFPWLDTLGLGQLLRL